VEFETVGTDDDGDIVIDDVVVATDSEGHIIAVDETVAVVNAHGDVVMDETVSVVGDDGELHVLEEGRHGHGFQRGLTIQSSCVKRCVTGRA